jgi:hypothetical protein
MPSFQIWALLLLSIAFSSAQLKPAPISQNGAAIIVNDCDFTVYYKSVSNHSVLLNTIPPAGMYKETYQLNIVNGTLNANGTVNGTLGGISIKLSSNQSIANAANESDAFDASTITQFEYTYNPNLVPGLWYDISNVNGYLDGSDRSWPFEMFGGLILEGTSSECPIVTCPPNNVTCSAAYTIWNDDWATHSCRNNNSLILTLCSTVSDSKALEEAYSGRIKEVAATNSLTATAATATATSCSN